MPSIFVGRAESGHDDNIDEGILARSLGMFLDPSLGVFLQKLPGGKNNQQALLANDLSAVIHAVRALGHGGVGLYWGINPARIERLPALSHGDYEQRESFVDGDVARRRHFLIDIDRNKSVEPDFCANDEEREKVWELSQDVLEYLNEQDWPAPFVVDSGNGIHLLYRVDEENNQMVKTAFAVMLSRLGEKFNGDRGKVDVNCHDARRIARLPGTWNRRGIVVKPGRPHRLCKLHSTPVTLDVLPYAGIVTSAGVATKVSANVPAELPRATPDQQRWDNVFKLNNRKQGIAYARAALEKECARVSLCSPTSECRNITLNKASFSLGSLVGGGLLDEGECERRLFESGCCSGLDVDKGCGVKGIRATIQSGLQAGKREPRGLPGSSQNGHHHPPEAPAATAEEPEERIVYPASEVTPRPVRWLWHSSIPLGKLTTFAGVGGIGKCVAEGTLIVTERGLVPIESLKPEGSGLGATPLAIKVQTAQGVAMTSHFYDSGMQPTITIWTRDGRRLTGTHNHPLLTTKVCGRNSDTAYIDLTWKPMSEFAVNDMVAVQDTERFSEIPFNKWDRVVQVDYSGLQHTYDLSVPDGHSFIANGIVSHNTFVLLDIASRISRGMAWPDNPAEKAPLGNVLFISGEDEPEDTLVPRLMEMGADLGKVFFMKSQIQMKFQLSDVGTMYRAIRQAGPNLLLVIIDPPTAYLGNVNDHKNAELRALLNPLQTLAAEQGCSIIFNTHVNKTTQKVDAMQRIIGSVAWANAVRAAHIFSRDPENEDQCLFVPVKNNLGPPKKGLRYHILKNEVDPINGQGRLEWLGNVDITADDAMNRNTGKPKRILARQWLIEKFREKHCWPSNELFAEGAQEGIHRSAIYEAKKMLDLPKARKVTLANGNVQWEWWVPENWPLLAQDAEVTVESPVIEPIPYSHADDTAF